ncbi:hypothetical protein CRUP_030743, partial [Coryphaenoides rupestris]
MVMAAALLLVVVVVFTSREQVRTPGSSVTFWTPEMRGGSDDDVMWKHGADRLLWCLVSRVQEEEDTATK